MIHHRAGRFQLGVLTLRVFWPSFSNDHFVPLRVGPSTIRNCKERIWALHTLSMLGPPVGSRSIIRNSGHCLHW